MVFCHTRIGCILHVTYVMKSMTVRVPQLVRSTMEVVTITMPEIVIETMIETLVT